jgi:hypothetical protein
MLAPCRWNVASGTKPVMALYLEDWTGLLRHEAIFCLALRA